MDAEGLGRKLRLTPPPRWQPRKTPERRLQVLWQQPTKCPSCKHFRVLSIVTAQREIPPHIAQYPFEIVSQRGVSHPFALFGIAQVSLRYPFWGGYRTSTSHTLQGGDAQKKGRGYRTHLAMFRHQKPHSAQGYRWDSLAVSRNTGPLSSQCWHCKERLPGQRKGFWVTSGNLSSTTAASIYTWFGILWWGGTLMGGNGFWALCTWRSDVVGHLESDTVLSCKCCAALVFLEQDKGCCISLAVLCLSVPCWGASGRHSSPVPPHPVPPPPNKRIPNYRSFSHKHE